MMMKICVMVVGELGLLALGAGDASGLSIKLLSLSWGNLFDNGVPLTSSTSSPSTPTDEDGYE